MRSAQDGSELTIGERCMKNSIQRIRLAYEKIRLTTAFIKLVKDVIDLVSLTFNYSEYQYFVSSMEA